MQPPVCYGDIPLLDRLKAIFSDGRAMNSRRSSYKACKALCCLNSSWPLPKFPDRTELPHFLCKLLALHVLILVQALLDRTASSCWPALLVRWKQKTLFTVGGAVFQLPCQGGRSEGPLQDTLNFPKRLSELEGPVATLSLGHELILLPVCNMGMGHNWYRFCSGTD